MGNQQKEFSQNITVVSTKNEREYIHLFLSDEKNEVKFKDQEFGGFLLYVAENKKYPWRFSILSDDYGPKYNSIFDYYKEIIKNQIDNNIFMAILDSDHLNLVKNTIDILSKLESAYQPKLFFILKNVNNQQKIYNEIKAYISNDDNYFYDKQDINFYFYNQDISSVFIGLMRSAYYFNELGDYTDIKGLLGDNSKMENNNKIITKLAEEQPKNNLTFNILICGRPGVGKSTFINALLGMKKCRVGAGKSVTKKIARYCHTKYPISIYDTPGFEDTNDKRKIIIQLIKDLASSLKEGKDKVHLVLFLINSSTERTALGNDYDFLKEIVKLESPVYFLYTKSIYEYKSEELISYLSEDLIRLKIINTELVKGKDAFLLGTINNIDDLKMKTRKINTSGFAEVYEAIYKRFESHKININEMKSYIRARESTSPNEEEREKVNLENTFEYLKNSGSLFFSHFKSNDDYVKKIRIGATALTTGYIGLAATIGAIPIPFSDMPILVSIQLTMIVAIGAVYGMTKSIEDAKAILKSCGALVAVATGGKFVASLIKCIPGVGTASGCIVDAIISASFTAGLAGQAIAFYEKELKGNKLRAIIFGMVENINKAVDGFKEIAQNFRKN